MANKEQFIHDVNSGYSFKGEYFRMGVGMLDGQVIPEAVVNIPLKTMNRHGLVAGATGTGKTKTLQMITEGLSEASVAVLVLDIKGDFSGIAEPGVMNKIIEERYAQMNVPWSPQAYPVELMSISQEKGVRLRATVMEYGSVLLSKVLGLNDNQEGLLAMLFKFADDTNLPILDLKDLIKLLQYAADDGNESLSAQYGNISKVSAGTIMRKVIELQNQGADQIFGELSFDINDLMRISDDGRGMVNILRVADIQDKPKHFSTFMLQLLAELYASLPEEGDLDKPKLVMFIDEAHLIFSEASSELLQQIESIVKLIRSKGVGVFFCTQNPQDIPASVLSQLGLKVQHALRAFTAKDRKAIKEASENYPETEYYEIDKVITQMGIGEAFVTMLNEKGIPTPLVHTFLMSPRSRMDVLSDDELDYLISKSRLVSKYNQVIDRDSAYEILGAKMQANIEQQAQPSPKKSGRSAKPEPSTFEKILNSQAGKQAQRTITRTLLNAVIKMFK